MSLLDNWRRCEGGDKFDEMMAKQKAFIAQTKECLLCQANVSEKERGIAVSDESGRLNLLMCQSCAAGTVLSMLLQIPTDEVTAIFKAWLSLSDSA